MRTSRTSTASRFALALSMATIASCAGTSSTMEGINSAMEGGPVVEAFIEYAGPSERWAGPASFVLHVVARESDTSPAEITAAPAVSTVTRKPASGHAMTVAQARGMLSYVIEQMLPDEQVFQGCLSPVRVRMVHEDGSLKERLGCRSGHGWPKAVSETVAQFLTAATYGMPGKSPLQGARAPASH